MAIVKSEQFEAFFAKEPRKHALLLLHGSDADLASERARRLVPKLVDDVADPFQVVRLAADVLAKDPGRLADEASAISMFGGRRVIWIDAGGRDFAALIAPAAENLPADTSILVEADSLRKGSAMRTLFETAKNAVAIECYPAPPASLAEMIETEARLAGVRIERDVRDHLVAALAAEPATARGEIAKLLLYARGAEALQGADIDALVAGAGPSAADETVDFAIAGDLAALERGAGRASDAEAALTAMRLASRVVMMLELRQGGGEERLNRLPFSVRRSVIAQANAWAPEALAQRLPALLKLLITTRRNPALAGSTTLRALASFALAAKRGR